MEYEEYEYWDEYEELASEDEFEVEEEDETCPHGLSLWLCADPITHYPADM